jgi:NAD(P)-dependent dehydrogenase (short-subunit alcohol dehydrogenase family)
MQQKKESELSILKGKTAVVTGSTSGIGLGCARAFAGAGANIVLNGIGAPADVERTRTAIQNDFGVKAIYSPANMAEPMEIASMIKLAEKTFGRVDVLVNNACLANRGFSGRKVGRSHRNQPLLRIPCDPCRYSWHEATRLGPNHQYGVGAFAGGIAI